jgi:DNA-binding GntR family transcriptional regulator
VRPIPDTPAYQRIADELRRQILEGELAPGEQMPSLAELAQRFQVSDRTAYEATRVLMREGLIHSRPGAPTLVRERPASVRMVRSWYRESPKGSPWHADMAAQGRSGTWEAHSEAVPAPPAIAERLRIEAGGRTMRTQYVFLADGVPTYLSTSWEPLALTLGTEIMLPEQGPHAGIGVADRMALIGHKPDLAVEDLVPRTLTGPEAASLGLRAGIPVIVIERTYWHGELPLETADIVIPPPYRPRYEIPIG